MLIAHHFGLMLGGDHLDLMLDDHYLDLMLGDHHLALMLIDLAVGTRTTYHWPTFGLSHPTLQLKSPSRGPLTLQHSTSSTAGEQRQTAADIAMSSRQQRVFKVNTGSNRFPVRLVANTATDSIFRTPHHCL